MGLIVNGDRRTKEESMVLSNIDNARLQRIRRGMIRRCYEYSNDYSVRGITVCSDWLVSFENFKNWAIMSGYKAELSIDRINNDLGYSPDNCRWATAAEQQRNRRDNIVINGCVLIDYLKSVGRNSDYDTIRYRISTRHEPLDIALRPVLHRG